MANKPTVVTGPFRVSVSPDGKLVGAHESINWPTDQKEIERKILGYFIQKMKIEALHIEDGGTEHLDFLLTCPRGKIYIELMEAVAPKSGGIPYKPGTQKHDCIEYAEAIFKNVQKKIDKYGFHHAIPIQLLLYVTHEQYVPAHSGYAALRRLFLDRKHPFELVFFIAPLAEDDVELIVIANRDDPVSAPSLAELAGQTWISVPSTEWKVMQVKNGKPVEEG